MSGPVAPSVGFIGLGRMGKPMATNLTNAGFHVVVHSRSQGPVAELVAIGATQADYPGEVAALADVVCTCLPDAEASETVYLASNGLVAAARPTNLFIETSTNAPSLARRIAADAQAKGAGYVDAPVSGGVEGAEKATLTIMAGGETGDVERARPVLKAMGANIHHVGGVGQGSVVKLINQLLVAVHTQAACEAMLLGIKAGVDPAQLLDVLSSSWGTSAMLGRTGPLVISGDYGSRAPMRLIAKDIALVSELASETELSLPLVERVAAAIDDALKRGLAESDIAALASLYSL